MEVEKVKTFSGIREVGSRFNRLTETVNEWLSKNGQKITITHRQVTVDEAGGVVTIWIFYVSR